MTRARAGVCRKLDRIFDELSESPDLKLLRKLLNTAGIKFGVPREVLKKSDGREYLYFRTSYGDGTIRRYGGGRFELTIYPFKDNIIRIRKRCVNVTFDFRIKALRPKIEEAADKRRREAVSEALNMARNLVDYFKIAPADPVLEFKGIDLASKISFESDLARKLLSTFGIQFDNSHTFRIRNMEFIFEGAEDLTRSMVCVFDVIRNNEHLGKVEILIGRDEVEDVFYPYYNFIGFFNGKEINVDIVPMVHTYIYHSKNPYD